MATGFRLNLTGLKPGETPPAIAVVVASRDGKVIHTAPVSADGRFDLPGDVMKNAYRVLIGPAGQDPSPDTSAAYARYRPSDFSAALEKGDLNIARAQWDLWRIFTTCVTGHVKVCRRSPWWYEDLAVLARQPLVSPATSPRMVTTSSSHALRAPVAQSIAEIIAWPARCAVICNGRVEVYRRTCCCEPWVINDPRLEGLLKALQEATVVPIPQPGDPGPEAVASASLESAFVREGALDQLAVFAGRDLAALRRLPAAELPAYVNARPYLKCRGYSCSAPVKVGEGDINPDGRFNICWRDWPRPLRAFCHDEYAYRVKQHLGLGWIYVYNGVAAHIWFSANDDATLVSYSPWAFGCRNNGDPGTGAFVYLDVIGDTGSQELETPASTGWDRVAAPGATSGLVFPTAASPLDRHRNWGGTLKLNYMFSEDLKLTGARYYRVSIAEADANGAPVGTRRYYQTGLSWTKAISGGQVVPVTLGPNPVGAENFLYTIPYDADADWEADQYHAHLDTTDPTWSNPLARHLVTIEIFDASGVRMRPNGTPATGQSGTEITAPFTYRRKTAATGPTTDVPFGALTHLFWWDNRPVHVEIDELVEDGVASTAECQFLVGTAASTFSINYRAYHEQVLFNRNHIIWWKRGLAGATGDILNPGLGNVGLPPAPPGASPTATFGTMLGAHKRCAFTVFLGIYGKTTDGDNLNYPYAEDTAAFALEVG